MSKIIPGITISESGNHSRGITKQAHADIIFNIGVLSQGFLSLKHRREWMDNLILSKMLKIFIHHCFQINYVHGSAT